LPDAIPVLTDIVEDEPGVTPATDRTQLFLDQLEADLVVAIHEQADELVHNACREMEALLLEQVSDRLRSELPALVARIVEEHFRGPDRAH
jgi:dihydroorotase